MTGAEFGEVDLDLLADYVGGALDGTPDETVVSRLIADDASWRDAYARLSAGVAAVTGQLQALGSVAEPMPADVLARLDTALLTAIADQPPGAPPSAPLAADAPGVTAGPAEMEPGSDGAAVDRHLVAVRSDSRGKRARRLRWAAPVGIAAGVLAFIGFAVQQQSPRETNDTASSAAAGQGESAETLTSGDQDLVLPSGSVPVTETGTQYRRDTLGQASRTLLAPADTDVTPFADAAPRKSAPGAGQIPTGSDPFSRLRMQDVLRACIDAITSEHGAGEIVPQTVDFAGYDGSPAVIVEFTAADGAWVWAAGTACGSPGVGADTVASVKVG